MSTTLLPLRPRTSGRFASLMDLYERNYMLVRLLAPALARMPEGEHVSEAPGAMPLVLDRIEHGRYTTTFNLTYRFSSQHRHAREPDLSIRLYHDARTCEVMSGLLPGERVVPRRTRDLDEGWRLNRFLHRWLGYCVRQGHGFGAGEEGATPSARSLTTSSPMAHSSSGRVASRNGSSEEAPSGREVSRRVVPSGASSSASPSGRADDGEPDGFGEGCPTGDTPLQRE